MPSRGVGTAEKLDFAFSVCAKIVSHSVLLWGGFPKFLNKRNKSRLPAIAVGFSPESTLGWK
jgi:hypothetical protein